VYSQVWTAYRNFLYEVDAFTQYFVTKSMYDTYSIRSLDTYYLVVLTRLLKPNAAQVHDDHE